MPIPQSVQDIPGRTSKATYELVFRVPIVPPLGFTSYLVSKHMQEETPQVQPTNFISNEVNSYRHKRNYKRNPLIKIVNVYYQDNIDNIKIYIYIFYNISIYII